MKTEEEIFNNYCRDVLPHFVQIESQREVDLIKNTTLYAGYRLRVRGIELRNALFNSLKTPFEWLLGFCSR